MSAYNNWKFSWTIHIQRSLDRLQPSSYQCDNVGSMRVFFFFFSMLKSQLKDTVTLDSVVTLKTSSTAFISIALVRAFDWDFHILRWGYGFLPLPTPSSHVVPCSCQARDWRGSGAVSIKCWGFGNISRR